MLFFGTVFQPATAHSSGLIKARLVFSAHWQNIDSLFNTEIKLFVEFNVADIAAVTVATTAVVVTVVV